MTQIPWFRDLRRWSPWVQWFVIPCVSRTRGKSLIFTVVTDRSFQSEERGERGMDDPIGFTRVGTRLWKKLSIFVDNRSPPEMKVETFLVFSDPRSFIFARPMVELYPPSSSFWLLFMFDNRLFLGRCCYKDSVYVLVLDIELNCQSNYYGDFIISFTVLLE